MIEDRGPYWNRLDYGLANPRSIALALYRKGIPVRGLSEIVISPAHPWNGSPGYVNDPAPIAEQDAATRKVQRFERGLTGDPVGMTCVAIANGMPVMVAMKIGPAFLNISGPLESHPAQLEPVPGQINTLQHYMVAVAFDAANKTIDMTSNMGGAPIVRFSFSYFGANFMDAYIIREFMGVTTSISPFNLVQANSRFTADVMKNLRYYMHNVIRTDYTEDGRVIPAHEKPAIVRAHMQSFGVLDTDLADAVAPWGLTLQDVRAFLAME